MSPTDDATHRQALLMGNVCVMKLPTVGGQCHLLTAEAFAECLPPGVINFISGSGRKCCPPIMQSGFEQCRFAGRVDAAATTRIVRGS